MVKAITKYVANDGSEHETEAAAIRHENAIESDKKSKFKNFMNSYNGKALAEQHSLNEIGIWQVKGEDPNCDFGGSHHEPDLGLYEGRLETIIQIAILLPGFWSWGGGGRIVKTEIKKPIKVPD